MSIFNKTRKVKGRLASFLRITGFSSRNHLIIKPLCFFVVLGFVVVLVCGCGKSMRTTRKSMRDLMVPTDVYIIRYHVQENFKALAEFTRRLYAKNPKYEKDTATQQRKIKQIFHGGSPVEQHYINKPSHEVLAAAFALDTQYNDRVYLLSLGMVKSFKEAYGIKGDEIFLSGLQIPHEQLKRLHHNISQVNWRLKTYRDNNGDLLFITNEAGADGYINMGYEVIMTEVLTRIKDDVYLRGGLPGKYFFNTSTLFVSILI